MGEQVLNNYYMSRAAKISKKPEFLKIRNVSLKFPKYNR